MARLITMHGKSWPGKAARMNSLPNLLLTGEINLGTVRLMSYAMPTGSPLELPSRHKHEPKQAK